MWPLVSRVCSLTVSSPRVRFHSRFPWTTLDSPGDLLVVLILYLLSFRRQIPLHVGISVPKTPSCTPIFTAARARPPRLHSTLAALFPLPISSPLPPTSSCTPITLRGTLTKLAGPSLKTGIFVLATLTRRIRTIVLTLLFWGESLNSARFALMEEVLGSEKVLHPPSSDPLVWFFVSSRCTKVEASPKPPVTLFVAIVWAGPLLATVSSLQHSGATGCTWLSRGSLHGQPLCVLFLS